jgi:hypothetical protein
MTLAGAATALVSLILHYTLKGDNQFGCNSERLRMKEEFITNQFCTREMAACSFLPTYLKKSSERGNASVACNETVSITRSGSEKLH